MTNQALAAPASNKTDREPIILLLPLPPSTNALWRRVGNKTLISAPYRAWKEAAGWEAKSQLVGIPQITGAFAVKIEIDPGRGDLDNRLKAILDLCQSSGAVANDKNLAELHAYRVEREGVLVELTPIEAVAKSKGRSRAPSRSGV